MWETIINDGIIVISFLTGLFGLNRKWPLLARAEQYVVQHAGEIAKAAETVVEAVTGDQTQDKLDDALTRLKKSEVGRLAMIGLRGFGVAYESLSDAQKLALNAYVASYVPGATQAQIEAALAELEGAVSEFGDSEIVKAANLLTAAQTAPTTA